MSNHHFEAQAWFNHDSWKLISHTPQVVIHKQKLIENIKDMGKFAESKQISIRPHFKTHKTEEIVQLQLQHGAIGVTVAKVSEAECLCATPTFQQAYHNGQHPSILIAFPLVSEAHFWRVKRLMDQGFRIMLMIDHLEQAKRLHHFAKDHRINFSLFIKVNSGLNRCGIEPQHHLLIHFIQELQQYNHLKLEGIMTHAGHAYGAQSPTEVQAIGTYEGEVMVALAKEVEKQLKLQLQVSVGSTPTVKHSGAIAGVHEIRPGNYCFYDRTQVVLGSASWENCALRVVTQVVSQPAPNRWIIDAGAKTLALDLGAHGSTSMKGYGYIVGYPELTITRLSEEHGIVEGHRAMSLQIGDILEIIPNHACPVVNLASQLQVLDGDNHTDNRLDSWSVSGRGHNY